MDRKERNIQLNRGAISLPDDIELPKKALYSIVIPLCSRILKGYYDFGKEAYWKEAIELHKDADNR